MRNLVRIEKNKSKKLRGSRKRKEDAIASTTTGTSFQIDTADDRFSALMEGTDARFGIDRTDPQYKETPAMQRILAEQSKRRRRVKKRVRKSGGDDDGAIGNGGVGKGGDKLSSLVKSLKTKVAKNDRT